MSRKIAYRDLILPIGTKNNIEMNNIDMKRDRTVIWRSVQSVAQLLMIVGLSLILAFALTSCTKEPLSAYEQPDKEYMDFSLELTPPGAYTPTKAMTTAQQNAINRAEVLVFQNDLLLYHKTGTVADIDGVKKRVQVNLKTSQTETELFNIMVIGNPPAAFSFTTYVGKTKAELKAAFNVSTTVKWAGSEFVMYGEALQTLIKPTTNNFKIQMLRSLARVDIGVGAYNEVTDTWAGLADFKLTEVRVVNSRNKFAVIPSATVLNESGNVKVSAPTIPAGAVAQGKTAADAILYNGADITSGNYTNSTIFIAEAPNTTDKVTLLIGGSYKGGATTFYRVDMCVPKAGALGSYDYLNILRNHLYRITITGVMAAGFTDAQEALNAPPMNIVVDMTATPEGGSGGNIVFDGQSFIMTDASSVLIYGDLDGLKTYELFTVKANFESGVSATVTGPGISGQMNLRSGISQTISAAIAKGTTTASYVVKVGRLTQTIPVSVTVAIDAHFDFLPFVNVASINIAKPQPWLTLSQNIAYKPSEQQSANVIGNAEGKAYVHFDENIATTGASRMAEALLQRKGNGGTTRVIFEQRNLSGMVLGYFGGAKDDYGYTKQVAVESIEEHRERVYDDTSIGTVKTGMQWGFGGISTGVTDIALGKAVTIALAKRADSGITGPYNIYNNYAARYCYDKNRDTNGNGSIDESEVVWYLPAQNQLMAAWIVRSAGIHPFSANYYWSAPETTSGNNSWTVLFGNGYTFYTSKATLNRVRCLREI